MAENETNGTDKETKELVAIPVVLFPDWKGDKGETDKRAPGLGIKYTIDLPVPKTDEQAKAIYNLTLAELLEKAVVQVAYGERKATDMLKNATKDQANDAEWQKGWAEVMKASLFVTPAIRSGKGAETKKKASKYDALMAKLGITDEAELEAIIARAQAKNKK